MADRKVLEKSGFSSADARWLDALNSAADLFQQATSSEDQIYLVFQKQVSKLGLRGGIALLDEDGKKLQFVTVAQSGRKSLLKQVESILKLEAQDLSVWVEEAEVISEVIREGETVFVSKLADTITQLLSSSEQSVVSKALDEFGRDPAIFSPLTIQESVIGMLLLSGQALTEHRAPGRQAGAGGATRA